MEEKKRCEQWFRAVNKTVCLQNRSTKRHALQVQKCSEAEHALESMILGMEDEQKDWVQRVLCLKNRIKRIIDERDAQSKVAWDLATDKKTLAEKLSALKKERIASNYQLTNIRNELQLSLVSFSF